MVKIFFKNFIKTVIATFVRIFIRPFLYFIPKNKRKFIFIINNESIEGNTIALFNYMKDIPGYNCLIFGRYRKGSEKNIAFSKLWKILNASVVVLDEVSMPWYVTLFTPKAKYIQLWHGNGMKAIGRLALTNKASNKWRTFVGYFVNFDIVYFSSIYAHETRKDAFVFKEFRLNGQPRNDIFFNIKRKEENNKKTILYAPTYRSKHKNIFDSIAFNKIDSFCQKNNYTFFIKLHPRNKADLNINYKTIVILKSNQNIYGKLHLFDLLITDYSSLYFDFLLLDKPILFFPFDKEQYLKERKIMYDYDYITPGIKVYNEDDLLKAIKNSFSSSADNFYSKERKRVRDLFYEYQDGNSCKRAMEDIVGLIK